MNTASAGVRQAVTLELIDAAGEATPIGAELHYEPSDPYAVTTVFLTAAGEVAWTFGRELLSTGLDEPAGDGDVHVWPCLDNDGHAVVILELCSPDGEALVQARTADLRAFVNKMHQVVAPGAESERMDIDSTIATILADAA